MKYLLFIFIFTLPFTQAIYAAPSNNLSFAICKNRKIVRTIRVDKADSGCETTYTKSGLDKVVGTGSHSYSCERIYSNIKSNLEKANWKCKEVASSKLSQSTEENPIQDTTFE